jgi:hypothetical protein
MSLNCLNNVFLNVVLFNRTLWGSPSWLVRATSTWTAASPLHAGKNATAPVAETAIYWCARHMVYSASSPSYFNSCCPPPHLVRSTSLDTGQALIAPACLFLCVKHALEFRLFFRQVIINRKRFDCIISTRERLLSIEEYLVRKSPFANGTTWRSPNKT